MLVSAEVRFWSKVKFNDIYECWEWQASKNRRGYGVFEKTSAPREAYQRAYGAIPDGLWVLHRCDNPGCVNPHHLFLGTNQDNTADRVRKGRSAHGPSTMHRAILTEDQVISIRAAVANGAMQKDVAQTFGVSGGTISMIVKRRIWKHI